jgi:hypothetical protein
VFHPAQLLALPTLSVPGGQAQEVVEGFPAQ